MAFERLEKKIKSIFLGGVLGASVLGSGCVTPEDWMFGGLAAGVLGMSPYATPWQSAVLGLARDTSAIGAGVATQRELSQRIVGAMQRGNNSSDSEATYQSPDFGIVQVLVGGTFVDYNGNNYPDPNEFHPQNAFKTNDKIIFCCYIQYETRNHIFKILDSEGETIKDNILSRDVTPGLWLQNEPHLFWVETNPGVLSAGTYGASFHGQPLGSRSKRSSEMLYIGHVRFTITE